MLNCIGWLSWIYFLERFGTFWIPKKFWNDPTLWNVLERSNSTFWIVLTSRVGTLQLFESFQSFGMFQHVVPNVILDDDARRSNIRDKWLLFKNSSAALFLVDILFAITFWKFSRLCAEYIAGDLLEYKLSCQLGIVELFGKIEMLPLKCSSNNQTFFLWFTSLGTDWFFMSSVCRWESANHLLDNTRCYEIRVHILCLEVNVDFSPGCLFKFQLF